MDTFKYTYNRITLRTVYFDIFNEKYNELTQVSRFSTGHFYFPIVLIGLLFCYIQIYFCVHHRRNGFFLWYNKNVFRYYSK